MTFTVSIPSVDLTINFTVAALIGCPSIYKNTIKIKLIKENIYLFNFAFFMMVFAMTSDTPISR